MKLTLTRFAFGALSLAFATSVSAQDVTVPKVFECRAIPPLVSSPVACPADPTIPCVCPAGFLLVEASAPGALPLPPVTSTPT